MRFATGILAVALMVPLAAGAEVAPFGQVIGKATMDSVKESLGNRTDIERRPDRHLGKEPVQFLESNGSGLGIEKLTNLTRHAPSFQGGEESAT